MIINRMNRNTFPRLACLMATLLISQSTPAADSQVRLITLDPGHFHAGLVQKFMYPQVDPLVHVYAPAGPDLDQHLKRVESFNTRAENPTRWQEKVYVGPDFLKKMLREKPGNVVVLSGNNLHKTQYIYDSVKAGLNTLADKPMAITPKDFDLLRKAFAEAQKKNVLIYDIMTERYEITSILQRELARRSDLFGSLESGSAEDPAVVLQNVHHYFKEVAGKPLVRPAWFFDIRQQGEAVPDVGTHLVDLVQWGCFPERILDWKKDIKVYGAKRWATRLTPAQFKKVTELDSYPDYLKRDVGADGVLNVYQNGDVCYTLKGVHAKVTALWNFEAPPGTKDTHYGMMRGTKALLTIKQGAPEQYQPVLYIENRGNAGKEAFEKTLRAAVQSLTARWPGVDIKPARTGSGWEMVIPEKYVVGHEAHFSEVTDRFLKYLADGKLPEWEVPNMIAKYYTTTEAYRLSRK